MNARARILRRLSIFYLSKYAYNGLSVSARVWAPLKISIWTFRRGLEMPETRSYVVGETHGFLQNEMGCQKITSYVFSPQPF